MAGVARTSMQGTGLLVLPQRHSTVTVLSQAPHGPLWQGLVQLWVGVVKQKEGKKNE